jgi:hypothetical protein
MHFSIYECMNDGRVNHEAGFREKLLTCLNYCVKNSTTVFRVCYKKAN